jgi:hypothetical protein
VALPGVDAGVHAKVGVKMRLICWILLYLSGVLRRYCIHTLFEICRKLEMYKVLSQEEARGENRAVEIVVEF